MALQDLALCGIRLLLPWETAKEYRRCAARPAAYTLQTTTTFAERCVLLCSGSPGSAAAMRGDRWQPAHSFALQQSVLGMSCTIRRR